MTAPARTDAARARPPRSAEPRLHLVPSPTLRPPKAPFVVLVVGLLSAGLVALLYLNTAIAENSFRMHDLQQRTAALNLQEQQLQREIDDLEAPGALAAKARKMGMVPAGNPAFIQLPDGTILGVPAPAKSPPPPPKPKVKPTLKASGSPAPNASASPGVRPAAPTPSPVAR